MELTSFEYISAGIWCKPVSSRELMAQDESAVYYHSLDENLSKLHLDDQLAAQPGFSDLHYCGSEFVSALVPNFDTATQCVYPMSRPFIARLQNVRVEFPGFGLFLDRHLLMEESYHSRDYTEMTSRWFGAHNNRHNMAVQIGLNASGAVVPASLDVKYYFNRETDQRIETPALMLSGASAYNYCHWMNEMVPRLWCWSVIPELRELPVIVRAPLLPFQTETLTALGIGPERILPFTGVMMEAKTLYFPSYLVPGTYCIQNLEWLRANLLPAFGLSPQPPQRLIYVSRGKAGSRRVLNEDTIITRLAARGFEIVHLEGMTVKQQLELFSSAAVVVMPAGAAGINMVFASPGATLIELHPSSYRHPMHFVHCSLIGCEYGCFICDDSAAPRTQDMIADADALVRVVDTLLGRKSMLRQFKLPA